MLERQKEVNVLREKNKEKEEVKIIRNLFHKQNRIKGFLGIAVCMMVFCINGFVSQAAEGKVIADTAKIRSEASTSSEVIGSTSKGKTVDIVGAVKDSSGTVWYKVPNGNNTYGYIRSDLIETSETITVAENTSSSTSTENTSKPAETVPTAIGEQQATISESSARIRSGASTQHDTVTSLPEGTTITLIGEASDSAGNKWYQMTCNYNNKTVEGYVRSDLIAIGAPVEDTSESEESDTDEETGTETTEGAVDGTVESSIEEPAEEEPAEPEYNDYEVVYNDGVYWLYNNIDSTMMKVSEVLNVVNTANDNNEKLQNQVQNGKIIIVILAVIIVILVVVITILIIKMKDLYYEEYEDEEEEEEPVVLKKNRRMESIEEEEPVKKKRSMAPETIQGKEKTLKVKKEVQPELRAAEKQEPARKQISRKAQNFLLDDDEFEFEFLNMDEKDF